MPNLTLVRDDFRPTATFGAFFTELDERLLETVERERDHNRASTATRPGACVPAGRYRCKRVNSPSQGNCFQLCDVPGRSYILIHSANWSKQLRGCIAPGLTRTVMNDNDPSTVDDMAVTSSKLAMKKFMDYQAAVDEFWLTIVDNIPEV